MVSSFFTFQHLRINFLLQLNAILVKTSLGVNISF